MLRSFDVTLDMREVNVVHIYSTLYIYLDIYYSIRAFPESVSRAHHSDNGQGLSGPRHYHLTAWYFVSLHKLLRRDMLQRECT